MSYRKSRNQRAGRVESGPPRLESANGRSPNRVAGGEIFVIAVAAYASTLGGGFTLDDVLIVNQNPLIRDLGNVGAIFTTDYWGYSERFSDRGLYRPLTILSYAVNRAVLGDAPAGYHAVNVLLHAAASVLLCVVIARRFDNVSVAALTGLLFAVHPIHTEAVAGIVGRAEILAFFGTMLCLYGYDRATTATPGRRAWAWAALCWAGYAVAVLSKEIGVVAPMLIVLWELIQRERRALFRGKKFALIVFGGLPVMAAAYAGVRAAVVEGAGVNVVWVDTPAHERMLTALRVCGEYVWLLVAPVHLSADYWTDLVPIARRPWEHGVLAATAMLVGLIAIAVKTWRRAPAVAWGVMTFVVLLFPVSNLALPIGVLKAERLLYAPSAGFLILPAAILAALLRRPRWRRPAIGLTAVVLFALWCRTVVRNRDWRDDVTLTRATLERCPDSPVFNPIMAADYRRIGDDASARSHLLRTIESQPRHATALFNLGNIELDERNFDAAIDWYRRALEVRPEYVSAMNNLGRALSEAGRVDEAIEVLNRSRSVDPDNAAAYVNLIAVYLRSDRAGDALPMLEEAIRRFPTVPAVWVNAAGVYSQLGRDHDAQAAMHRANQLRGRE
jgi:tetratricopeptide (TPR) repeat protein